MRTLYGSTSWRRVLALVLVFVMMVSTMGASGYSVFAEDLVETNEEVTVSEPEANVPEVTEDIQGPSPGEEESEAVVDPATDAEPVTDAELVEASEEDEEPAEDAETVPGLVEGTEEGTDAELVEENAETVPEPVEGTEEGADAELVEETEETEPVEPAEDTLISEAAKVIEEDDGEAVAELEMETVAEPVEGSEEAVEELPEEPVEEPEKVVMSAIDASEDFEESTVYVSAPKGAFPEDTKVKIEQVNLGRKLVAAVVDAVEEISDYIAYDITFYNDEQTDMQPAEGYAVKVNIEPKNIDTSDSLQVIHIDQSGDKPVAEIIDNVDTKEQSIEFEAEKFSIYVIVSGDTSRFRRTYKFQDINGNGEYTTYTFYNEAGHLVDNQIIKNDDVLDPVGTPYHNGYDFTGWYLWDAEAGEFGDEIAIGTPISGITKDEEVIVRAKYGNVYYIDFHENAGTSQEDIILTTCVVPETESYAINDIKAPIPGAGFLFSGWAIGKDSESIIASPFTPEEDTDLYPIFVPGYWLRFIGNGTGASYTEAISLSATQDLSTVTKPADPTREGYTFDNWYTAAEGGEVFTWSGTLKADTPVYAHWTPADAEYSVFYWIENADDDEYTFLTSKTLTGTAGTDTAAEDLTAREKNSFTGINWNGFEFQTITQVTIKGDGSSIVNVYYDRKLVTLSFHTSTATSYVRDNNGDYYQVSRSGGNNNTNYYYKSGDESGYSRFNNNDRTYYKYRSEGPLAYIDGDTIPLYTRSREIVWDSWFEYHYEYSYSRANNVNGTITRYRLTGGEIISLTAKYGADIHTQWPNNPAGESKWYTSIDGNTYSLIVNSMPVADKDYYYRTDSGNTVLRTVYKTQDLNNLKSFSEYNSVSYNTSTDYGFPIKTADDYTGIKGFSINAYSQEDANAIVADDSGDPNATYNSNYPRSPKIGTSYRNGEHSGNTYTLTFYYLRNQYDIEFVSDGSIVDTITDIYYETNISGFAPEDYVVGETEAVIGGANCIFQGWYDNVDCEGAPYTFNTMPASNLVLYAKWEKAWYIVTVDPNGGVLNGGDPTHTGDSTWYWVEYGELAGEYPTSRDYVADSEGEYYYHKSIHQNDANYDRLAYYTTDSSVENDGKTYRYEPGVYVFEGWYALDQNGNKEAQPYDFQAPVTRNLTIQAQWRKTGAYTVAYNGFDGQIGGNIPDPASPVYYADGATITLGEGPTKITPLYIFNGWDVLDPSGETVDGYSGLNPGDKLTLNAEWANNNKVIHLQARYSKVDESTEPIGITKLILNANGGQTSITPNDVFPDENGKPVSPIVENNIVTYENLPINQSFDLSKVNTKFTREGYVFKGWNTNASATDILYDETYTIGVDNENPTDNTLYAIWEKVETYTVVYTDGVEGAVIFADQTTGGLIVGEDTPKFTGSLKRENYVFVAWDPTFNATIAAKDADANNTITYTATWKDDKNATDKPDDEEEYTVEYKKGEHGAFTEGVAGKTTFTELALNAPTPSYAGEVDSKQNPLGAKDYAFDGWDKTISRTILAEDCTTGTCIITYTAKWADDKNNNDIPDKNEYFTVVYTDGVENEEVFADQSHPELLVGADTPAFNGTPTRSGYTFSEWTPSKQDKVRAEDADEDNVITYTAQWTAKETPAVTYTILYNSNYSTYSSLADIEKLDGPAASLIILSPDNAKLGFAEKVGSDPIWTNGDQKFKFIGWSLQSAKGSAIYEGTTYPETATTPAGQDDAGNATIIDQQSMNPRSAGASSLATRAVLKTLAMAATSSKGDTPDLTLYAQWKEVVEPVEPNPHLTVTKTVDPEPAENKKFALDEEIVYKITVTNDGNVELGDIKVTDTLNVTVAEGESLEIKSLQPGESKTITVTYKVTQEDINRGSITNGATAEGKIPGSTEDIPVTPGEVTVPTNKPDDGGNTPSGGGGTRPPKEPDPVDPTDDPGEPIDDPDTPLAPGTIDEPEEPIDDPDTPLAPYDEETEIDDEATPLTPFTGDDRHTDVWAFLSVLSLAGIVLLGRKRREEE